MHLTDPVERLNAVHRSVSHHRARGEAEAERSVLEIVGALPFAVGAWAFRLAGQFPVSPHWPPMFLDRVDGSEYRRPRAGTAAKVPSRRSPPLLSSSPRC